MPASCKSHGSVHSAGTATISSWASRCLRPCRPSSSAPSSATNSAHLSRKQTRFRNWIYRSRQSWSRIAHELIKGGGVGVLLLAPFLSWYSAYFGAYTFVLARANEYDADRASAKVAGRGNTAAALTTIAAKGRYFGHKFWG